MIALKIIGGIVLALACTLMYILIIAGGKDEKDVD